MRLFGGGIPIRCHFCKLESGHTLTCPVTVQTQAVKKKQTEQKCPQPDCMGELHVREGTVLCAKHDMSSPEAEWRKGWEEQGGVKFDQDKPRMDLLDAYALEELAKVLTFGAKKYAPHNWRKGIVMSRLIAASARHLFAIIRGEDTDEETGLAHAAHLMCCAMFMIWTLKHKPDMDDRWKLEQKGNNNDKS